MTHDTLDTGPIANTLATLLAELVDGASPSGAFVLNGGDRGLLRSLDALSAEAASARPAGGASIAAHVDHLRYGLSLMNRWGEGEENPYAGADWTESWRRGTVSEEEWARSRAELATEVHRWLATLRRPREVGEVELMGMLGSIVHLAYHLGSIRQIDRAA
ncbi:MAG TPA: DinB family protein, partial [Gemmatimonadaceae bacterium]|nr:DinB family protein [Gemmatimonadaceae bacterium]